MPFLTERTSFPFYFSPQKLDIGLELVRKGYAVELPEDMEENRTVPDVLHDEVSELLQSLRVSLWGKSRALRDMRTSSHETFCRAFLAYQRRHCVSLQQPNSTT